MRGVCASRVCGAGRLRARCRRVHEKILREPSHQAVLCSPVARQVPGRDYTVCVSYFRGGMPLWCVGAV